MELSQQKQKEAKKLGTTVQNMLMADLMAIGYNETDAYTIAYPENIALSAVQNKSIRENITSSPKFKKLYDERCNNVGSGVAVPLTLDEMELVGTEEVLKEILRSAKQQPVGSKERADLYAKYNDIKKDSEQNGRAIEDPILFAFPIKCYQCPLLATYNDFLKENGDKEIRPIEMERIIRLADGIIKKAIKKGAEN